MDEKRTITIKIADKELSFQMMLGTNSASDLATSWCLDSFGVCEPEVCHLMARAVRPWDTVIDGGANIGFFTLLLARLVGPNGKVIAFEPALQNVAKLKDNIDINGMKFVVELHEDPLWLNGDEVELWTGLDSGISSLKKAPNHLSSTVMHGVQLRNYAKECRLIKLDIEGAEYFAMKGGGPLITPERCPFIVCEMNPYCMKQFGYGIKDVRQLMSQRGYDLFLLRADGSIPALVTRRTEVTNDKKNLNVLFSTPLMVAEAWPRIHFKDDSVDI